MLDPHIFIVLGCPFHFFRQKVAQFPKLIVSIHGLGLMIGIKCVVPCGDMLNKLRSKKLLVGKSGANMIRLLPPLNISYEHLDQALQIIEEALLEFQDA